MNSSARGRHFLIITRLAVVLSLTVIVLGAYVRLSDAGLGCPDWPGCYGRLFISDSETHAQAATVSGFERPYEHDKAWKEMAHRYLAGFLGLLILAMAVLGWMNRRSSGQPWKIPLLLVGLVILQAALGMWTVTLLLKPAVVLLHLLGGMTILALLFWTALRTPAVTGRLPLTTLVPSDRRLMPWALLALVIVFIQISLGGWVSTNYAALICADFPACQGQWWPPMDFGDGFTFWRGLGVDYEYGVLGPEAMTAVHMAHRIGAVISLLVVGGAAGHVMINGSTRLKWTGAIVAMLLLIQLGIGIANIVWLLPLWLAVAHNAGAALLLLSTIALLHQTTTKA
ncbi:MAG: COX15/CtaA family protein [Gammaproteobacteria bacterium]|nr:COX15/CtaA family protein [Gammaproteobacteria bacterium]